MATDAREKANRQMRGMLQDMRPSNPWLWVAAAEGSVMLTVVFRKDVTNVVPFAVIMTVVTFFIFGLMSQVGRGAPEPATHWRRSNRFLWGCLIIGINTVLHLV